MGQYSEAEDNCKQALAIYRTQGADSSYTAERLYNLGRYYEGAGDESKAVETYREALDMYIRVDPDNPQISEIRDYVSSVTSTSSDTDTQLGPHTETHTSSDITNCF